MSRTKEHYWPPEPPAPRPPRPLFYALRAAYREFWRVLYAQRRLATFRKDFTIF